jgi:hypothetical protein
MNMGNINDFKLFKLWTLYYSLGSQTPQASKSPFRWRRCDGLKLNINSLRQFLYNNNLKGLSLYNNIMLWLKL